MLLKNKIKRAKPLLGTFVEITLYSDLLSEQELIELSTKCYKEIQRVQDLMSFFEKDSEISSLNIAAPNTFIEVSNETFELLKFSDYLFVRSEGKFDVLYQGREKFPDVKLLFAGSNKVSKTKAVSVDLGGIAKGYAVDRAAMIVENDLHISGVINAGGDIRFVGNMLFPLSIRSPINETKYLEGGSFSSCAIATSLFDKELDAKSITVIADSCIIADSLTKAIFGLSKEKVNFILNSFNARCIEIDSSENVYEFIQ